MTCLFPRARLAVLASAIAVLFTLVAAHDASAQASRTWVSGVGTDTDPCSRANPCKTWAGAYSKTAVGGEIDALTPGGFGTLTIDHSITIDGAASFASSLNTGTTGFNIGAAPTDDVIIRNVVIAGTHTGGAPPACPYSSGQVGIRVQTAHSVSLENVRIQNQSTGVRITPNAAAIPVTMDGVTVDNTCSAAVDVAPTNGGTSNVILQDAVLQNAQQGSGPAGDGAALRVGAGGHAFVIRSVMFNNTIGLAPLNGGMIDLYSDSQLVGNGTDGTPTATPQSTIGPPGPTGATGPQGSQGPAGQQGATGPVAFKLVLALVNPSLRSTVSKKVTLGYISTVAGTAKLEVVKGRKTLVSIPGRAGTGRNKIGWNGKVDKKPVAAGSYTLKLTVTTADGQTESQTAKLTLKKKAK